MRRMYAECQPGIMIYVSNNNGSKEQFEDIYHEAFMAVWRNIRLGKFSPESQGAFNAYLTRVAKNKWIDQLRKKDFKLTREWKETDEIVQEPLDLIRDERDEYLDKVVSGFEKLGEQCKKLLSMFYYKNETMKNIASVFGWTDATARNNKYRCLQKLRDIVNKPGSE